MSLWGWFGHPLRTKSGPEALTRGPDGAVWYAAGSDSKIGRLDYGF